MLTRNQRLSEQYHRGNIKASEIHWRTLAIQNFSQGDSNYQYTPGRYKIQTFFTGDWFCGPHFHLQTFLGGFSQSTEAGCIKRLMINEDGISRTVFKVLKKQSWPCCKNCSTYSSQLCIHCILFCFRILMLCKLLIYCIV